MTDQTNKILVRAVDCLEILNNRPRPMCRDCADFGPICPHTGLDCNVKDLIASARAALSASAPAAGSGPSDVDKKRIAHNAHVQCSLIPGATFYNAAEAAIDALLAQYGSPARSDADREVIEAARNLVKVKGRHHGELAYKRLADAVASAPQEGK